MSDHPSAPDDLRAELVAKNTDREIWRKGGGDGNGMSYYEPTINVTAQDEIAIEVGGTVYVKPVEEWHRLAALPVLAVDRDGEKAYLVPDDIDCGHRVWVRDDEGGELWACPLCALTEAREQLAVERGKVAAVIANLSTYRESHPADVGVYSLSDGIDIALHDLRAILADPGQWEAEVKAAALREARQFFLAIDMPIPADHIDQMLWALKGEAQDPARADRVADGGES